MPQYHSPNFNLNISLACHKCGVTMNDLYETLEYQRYGLLDGTDNKGISTKLWMTSCNHIVCYKHLPGGEESVPSQNQAHSLGLVPFYPQDVHPTVSCPICPSKHPTPLFWIRGTDNWQHDPSISQECFVDNRIETCKQPSPQYSALSVHMEGARAAARLYAAQIQVAASLLCESEQRIAALEQETIYLKAQIRAANLQQSTSSRKGQMLPPPRPLTSFAMQIPDTKRVSLKRAYEAASPDSKIKRQCLPERGILHAFGTPRRNTDLQDSPVPRIEEIDVLESPAFSTPCMRANLSPMKGGNSSAATILPSEIHRHGQEVLSASSPNLQLQRPRFDRKEYQ